MSADRMIRLLAQRRQFIHSFRFVHLELVVLPTDLITGRKPAH